MVNLHQQLNTNLAHVRSRIEAACAVSGRLPSDVTLVAVTKYAQIDWIDGLIQLGVTHLGENRPQQLVDRQSRWPQVQWHLIGHLQRNKVKSVLVPAAIIHSVDSLRLAARISELATTPQSILFEVNVSGESSKDGFTPTSIRQDWSELVTLPNLRIRGLMTMAPLDQDAESARPVFVGLRQLRDELQSVSPDSVQLNQLSMGMSGDFEVAIEEGATLIRVGSRLFEGLS